MVFIHLASPTACSAWAEAPSAAASSGRLLPSAEGKDLTLLRLHWGLQHLDFTVWANLLHLCCHAMKCLNFVSTSAIIGVSALVFLVSYSSLPSEKDVWVNILYYFCHWEANFLPSCRGPHRKPHFLLQLLCWCITCCFPAVPAHLSVEPQWLTFFPYLLLLLGLERFHPYQEEKAIYSPMEFPQN